MASKGKGIAGGGSSGGGKRKHDDDKSGGGWKRSNRSVLQFFEDSVAEFDDGDDSDLDDFMEEDFERDPIGKNEPGKAHNLPFIPKEEDLDGDEFEKLIEERYRSGSSYVTHAEDNYENKRSIDGSVLEPSLKDPIIWKVKCMVGRERHSAFCIMQKFANLKSLKIKLQIISAFAVDHIKGFVFIEADKQSDINEACRGLCNIYLSRVMQVPNNEVSNLLSPRTRSNEITAGMWARVKNGNYKGDLAQVVAVNNSRKRATIMLIPRIDLQAKFGGGATRKKMPIPAPRLISSNELEEFRPLIQYRKDSDTGMRFQFLDGLMLKDGYLYKKVAIDSLSFWGVTPSKEELLKFKPTENNDSEDLQWLSELYGKETKRRIIKSEKGGGKGEGTSGSNEKGGDKGEGTSGSNEKGGGTSGSTGKGKGSSGSTVKGEGSSGSTGNCSVLFDLVCFGRKDFGLVIGMEKEKDDSYKIMKEGPGGLVIVTVQKKEVKIVLSDVKFTALDQRMKAICVNDTVRVLEGPLKDRQGIVKHIYRGTIFLYDENETENGGYFCSKSQMCEKIKLDIDACKGKDGDSGGLGFEDFMSSPKSPLSPKKPWQDRDTNFNRGDTEGMFSIGQTVRIRVGPLKGYLCRVLAIRRSDITVKLDSQQKVLTVKCEHLSEVRAKIPAMLTSEDPESSCIKPFDLLGTEGGSTDWTNGAGTSAGGDGWNVGGTSAGGDGWNAGGTSAEGNSWPSFSAPESSSANPLGHDGYDVKKDDTSWESKAAPNKISSWGAATAAADNSDKGTGWGKGVDSWGKSSAKTGGDSSASDTWQKATEPTAKTSSWGDATAAADNNDQGTGWGKGVDSWGKSSAKTGSDSSASDTWQKATEPTATAGNSQLDSWGKGKNVVEAGSWQKKSDVTSGDISSSGWGQQKSLDKGNAVSGDGSSWGKHQNKGASWGAKEDSCSKPLADWSNKDESNVGDAGWKSSMPAVDVQTGNWGNAGGIRARGAGNEDEASGWTKSKIGFSNENQNDIWKKASGVDDDKRASWVKEDGGSTRNKQDGDSTWNKQGGGSAWNKPAGDSSWGKQNGGSSWSKQADVTAEHGSGVVGNQDDGWKRAKSFGGDQGSDGWSKGSGDRGGRRGGRGGGRGGREFGRGRSFNQDQSSGWNKDQENSWSSDGTGGGWKNSNAFVNGSGWNKGWGAEKESVETVDKQNSSWGSSQVARVEPSSGAGNGGKWSKGSATDEQSGNSDRANIWNASKEQSAGGNKSGDWNAPKSSDGDQASGWGQSTAWKGGSSGGVENQNSTWSKKSNWNSGSGDAGGNHDSNWGKKSDWNSGSGGNQGSNQDANWGKKSNWNSGSGDTGGHKDSDGGRKSSWNSGSSDADQNSSWNSKNNWNSGSSFGGSQLIDGGNGDQREDFNNSPSGGNWRGGSGRGNSDRGGFRGGRGFGGRGGDRGDFAGRGGHRGGFGGRGGDRGSFGGGDRSDRGGFGGRGGSDREGFGGSGGSDRGFGGRGRGRDQSGGWSSRNDNNSSGWGEGGEGACEGWKNDNSGGSWNQGDGSKNNWQGGNSRNWSSQSSDWNQSGVAKGSGGLGSGWGQSVEAKDTAGPQDKGIGSQSEAGGSRGNNWKSSDASTGGWNKGSSSTAQAGGWGNQGSGWNKGTGSGFGGGTGDQPSAADGSQSSDWKQSSAASAAQSSGWNKSGEAKQVADEGAVQTNSWGKAAASSRGKGEGVSGKGGW